MDANNRLIDMTRNYLWPKVRLMLKHIPKLGWLNTGKDNFCGPIAALMLSCTQM